MDFLIKPCSFLFIILFAYFLKRVKIFQKEHALLFLKVIMYVTLPATVVTVFETFQREYALGSIIVLGLGMSVIPFFLLYFSTRKMKQEQRVYYMICCSGSNVGCYGLPIIQAFYGGVGALICVLYDIGNAIMMTSGNYAFTAVLLKTEAEAVTIRAVVKKFFSSVPVCAYLILFVLGMAGIKLPTVVHTFVEPIASANAFLAMFMLGLLLEPCTKLVQWKQAGIVLAIRYGIGIGAAIVCYHCLPLSAEIRQIVVLLLLCPIGSMAPGFVEQCHGDGELAAFTNSVSTVVSLVLMTVLTMIFKQA